MTYQANGKARIAPADIRYDEYEKPDIMEVVEALELDLTWHGEHTDKPYLNGYCPIHNPVNNMTTLIVYPNIQRWECKSCCPGKKDSIELYARIKRIPYAEALAKIGRPLDSEEILQKLLGKQTPGPVFDYAYWGGRIRHAITRLTPELAIHVSKRVSWELERGRERLADQLLKQYERD